MANPQNGGRESRPVLVAVALLLSCMVWLRGGMITADQKQNAAVNTAANLLMQGSNINNNHRIGLVPPSLLCRRVSLVLATACLLLHYALS